MVGSLTQRTQLLLAMGTLRFPGPICQTRDWFDELHEGTLVRAVLGSPPTLGLGGASGSAQPASPATATGACAYLNPRTSGTVVAPAEAFDRLRASAGAARITPPQPRAAHTWPDGSSSAAVEQEIQIDRQTIRVIRPTDTDARGRNLPTTAVLAEALRALPANQRVHTRRVVISPRPHRGSTATRTIAGEAGSGEITLFPVNSPQTQTDFDNRLTHESGHNYQGSLWQSAEAVQEWRTAAAADNSLPSPYAGENAGDDFCEFNILYNAARGSACEAEARRLYPNRWAKFTEYQSR